MSIATRTGDTGTTGLMYNRRVPKCHPRVEACGCVDELNAAIGLARATSTRDFVREPLRAIQRDLIVLMGELATLTDDLPRYVKDGFHLVTPAMTARLDALVKEIESRNVSFKGWATPGDTLNAAALDFARTACRRAERRCVALREGRELENAEILVFLNRLSDTLWLLARWEEDAEDGKDAAAET
jgi:cob(I)alamin adenosyltransferase